jgi:predicted RecB family nuclease
MYFATDLANFLACRHIATLDRAADAGEITKDFHDDPGLELLKELGLRHEQAYLNELQSQGRAIVSIPTKDTPWSEANELTRESMQRGADVIYQATFINGQWGGRADFLVRVETPSAMGDWSYEAVETKLAHSTKARALIQLCLYSELIAAIQGSEPNSMDVVLGGGVAPEKFGVRRYLAFFRKIKRDFEAAIASKPETYPEPVEHCAICDWFRVCNERWHNDDHLSLVAYITRNQREALVEREVNTMTKLATLSLPVTPKIERIAPAPLLRIREQARVQVEGREQGKPVFEFFLPNEKDEAKRERRSGKGGETPKKAEALRGFAALPPPSSGDLFLDFEGDPFAFDQGLEYLIGTVTITNDCTPVYEPVWSFDPKSEKQAFIQFIERVKRIREAHPDMHIYHYAPYEPTAIKHLSGRHGVCADEVDELLRAGVFVDLFRVVRQGLRASVESYSIKKMEEFYGFRRTVELRDATSSLQAFETVLALEDKPEEAKEILNTIADYNRDDCLSTWQLREWLEILRRKLEEQLGQSIERPELKSGAPSEDLEAELTEIVALKERLVAGLPEEESEWSTEQRACWLLAQLLEWHRREDKSMWWEYYRLCSLTDEELIEDRNALAGLTYLGVVDETKRSLIHRYSFPPQDHTLDGGRAVHDPDTEQSACSKFAIDEINLTIDLKRGKASEKPHPTALIPNNYFGSKEQVASLMRIAKWVADNGINKPDSQFQAARDALLRLPPRIAEGNIGTAIERLSPLEAAKKLALTLDHSILPIQGPPGSGKTFTGAHMIIELVNAGKRVGVTANSHKVITNLLSALCEEAEKTNTKLSIVQKPNETDGCYHASVTQTDDNGTVLEKLQNREAQIGAGTPWLWSRPEFANSVDVLLIDEAGQMSLANVLAVSPAAKSVVLLGDPQQLDQPQKGVHPPGAEVSALAHLLNGRATIEPEQGLFLAESWRLHPDICAFTSEVFYDGRLKARSENAQQRLNASGPLDGTGLRFVPFNHTGNKSDSPEEVEAIAKLVEELLSDGTTWTNKKGVTSELEWKHILIVAPYNAQVALLTKRLPKARVGTVDKFQGQQAPIVFYSMTTSTPEDAPRGMEFLYSANRLNVATSRAQCVTVLVANPALFDVQCKTPRQMELANAFCRYLEMAKVVRHEQ